MLTEKPPSGAFSYYGTTNEATGNPALLPDFLISMHPAPNKITMLDIF